MGRPRKIARRLQILHDRFGSLRKPIALYREAAYSESSLRNLPKFVEFSVQCNLKTTLVYERKNKRKA